MWNQDQIKSSYLMSAANKGELTIRKVFAADKDTMQVALCPAIGDVSPILILINLPEPCKPMQHAHLHASKIAMKLNMSQATAERKDLTGCFKQGRIQIGGIDTVTKAGRNAPAACECVL